MSGVETEAMKLPTAELWGIIIKIKVKECHWNVIISNMRRDTNERN